VTNTATENDHRFVAQELSPTYPQPTIRIADAVDPLVLDLHTIATSNRVLANRIAELESEVARQAAVAERLRQRLASGMANDMTGPVIPSSLSPAEELAGLKATKLFRWSARPRQAYHWLRTKGPAGQ
jgi:hypothetical protein